MARLSRSSGCSALTRTRSGRGSRPSARWWVAELARLPGVVAERVFPGEAGRPLPRVRVAFDAGSGLGGPRTRATLLDGDPRVAVAADGDRGLLLNAETLAAGQEQVVLDAIRALVLPRVAP